MSAGPCTKQTVTATIVLADGRRFVGTNWVRNHQAICPRGDMPTGVGYELCRDVCGQSSHAEADALRQMYLVKHRGNATCYIEGHTYACEKCTQMLEDNGVPNVVIGSPPP